ncbi:hypothetical protein SAMN06297229_1603 [Pseudidiomarina planktonica]|uniref:Uncharacterized protein n=1 Tax=Pseudidiomarina planktonica TaxID=1323738 RepID=A0A1Y6EXN5_9GAMM|nr:hypothetical protein [Pseudidiomarina planktonica]RUO65047.1 hypothetical protein CWI77_00760 [Pseudidiomarina planktonica]SMQ67398.1 hypothetical protein SAMN06297229_1603 [Pseudidiomarina planktonica]
MIITIVIILIVALVVLAIAVNAIQQHKQRAELERRQKLARYKLVFDQSEDLINAASNLPVGRVLILTLNKRALDAVKRMLTVAPTSENKNRIEEYQQRVKAFENQDNEPVSGELEIPENDKQVIGMLNAIKKLRNALRSEHSKGRIDTTSFLAEDRKLVKIQVQVSVESLIRRGKMAYRTQMLGSARQYYEKALKMLEDQSFTDEYITSRKAQVSEDLDAITEELRDTNARDASNRKKDELEELFQPKRKW